MQRRKSPFRGAPAFTFAITCWSPGPAGFQQTPTSNTGSSAFQRTHTDDSGVSFSIQLLWILQLADTMTGILNSSTYSLTHCYWDTDISDHVSLYFLLPHQKLSTEGPSGHFCGHYTWKKEKLSRPGIVTKNSNPSSHEAEARGWKAQVLSGQVSNILV